MWLESSTPSKESSLDQSFTLAERVRLETRLARYSATAPQLKDFIALYDETAVQRDLDTLERRRAGFTTKTEAEQELYFYGRVLELIIDTFAEVWLPGTVCRVSEFDDLINSTDGLLEVESANSDQILRLLFDATSDGREAKDKLDEIQKQLERGRLGSVKYFDSSLEENGAGASHLKVVIGTGRKQVIELGRLLLNYDAVIAQLHAAKQDKNEATEDKATTIQTLVARRQRIFDQVAKYPLGYQLNHLFSQQIAEAMRILQALPHSLHGADHNAKISELKELLAIFHKKEKALVKPEVTGRQSYYPNPVFQALERELG